MKKRDKILISLVIIGLSLCASYEYNQNPSDYWLRLRVVGQKTHNTQLQRFAITENGKTLLKVVSKYDIQARESKVWPEQQEFANKKLSQLQRKNLSIAKTNNMAKEVVELALKKVELIIRHSLLPMTRKIKRHQLQR